MAIKGARNMQQIDRELEQRVWERVNGGGQERSLQALAAAEKSAGALYLMLARLMQGRAKEQLRQLYHRTQTHGRYLGGMNMLLEGQPLSVHTAPPEPGRTAVLLSRCYTGALRAAEEYEKRGKDRTFGPIFERMAQNHRDSCATILELMGQ